MLPDIPIDAFRTCIASGSIKIQISAHAIGAVFGELFGSPVAAASRLRQAVSDVSAFSFIIWVAYSNAVVIRFPSLLRTVVADATVYFIIAMGLQTLVLLFLSFADVRRRPLPIPTFLTHSISGFDKSIPTCVRTLSPHSWSLASS